MNSTVLPSYEELLQLNLHLQQVISKKDEVIDSLSEEISEQKFFIAQLDAIHEQLREQNSAMCANVMARRLRKTCALLKHSEQEIRAKDYLLELAESSLLGNGPTPQVLITIISANQGTSAQKT